MAQGGEDNHISKYRHPIRWLQAWFDEPERSRCDSVKLTLIATGLIFALNALSGVLLSILHIFSIGGALSTALLTATAGLGVGVGAAAGIFAAHRWFFGPRLSATDTELAKAQAEISRQGAELTEAQAEISRQGAELTEAQGKISHLEPYKAASRRHEAYAKHIHLLLLQLHGAGIEPKEDLLLEPAKVIEKATGIKVRLSIWVAQPDTQQNPRWQIELAPDLTDRQCQAFRVPLDGSWISYMEKQKRHPHDQKGKSTDFVFGIDNFDGSLPEGNDLTAFNKHGFKSLRGTGVVDLDVLAGAEDGDTRCLVALAEQPGAFAETEDWYLIFLGELLSLHRYMNS